jgi:hypothetical protein
VVNFDVPLVPEDYIHRVGRTGRADAVGDAFTFVSPQEEGELRAIERAVGKRLPRVVLPDFDYNAKPAGALEIPARRADRTDPRQEGGGPGPRQGQGRSQGHAVRRRPFGCAFGRILGRPAHRGALPPPRWRAGRSVTGATLGLTGRALLRPWKADRIVG